MNAFMQKFRFNPVLMGRVGVERECLITSSDGAIVPRAHDVLTAIGGPSSQFGYELSACQLESRVGPISLEDLPNALTASEVRLKEILSNPHGLVPRHVEVGPKDMPLDVYPDPTGRYQAIVKDMPRDRLLAACRVLGTHVHVGMPDHGTALRVYNRVVPHSGELCTMGDDSCGQRLAIYRTMAPRADPVPYESWEQYHRVASAEGFADDPRQCWALIRISVHGTIEFRMFGATADLQKVLSWARFCHAICLQAM